MPDNLLPLAAYAAKVDRDPATIRQKILRGALPQAVKLGLFLVRRLHNQKLNSHPGPDQHKSGACRQRNLPCFRTSSDGRAQFL